MSAAKAKTDMKELKDIKTELNRLNHLSEELKTKKKRLEENIMIFLDKNKLPGIKFEDLIIQSKPRKQRERKKAKEKEEDVVKLLERNGISNSTGVYKQICEALKGKENVRSGIQIKEQK
jgi:hypothetical protein